MGGTDRCGIDLAIRFKRSARTQQFYPDPVVEWLILVICFAGQELREMRIQQGGGGNRPFEKASNANKVPALAMAQCRIGNTLEKINALFHVIKESMWLRVPYLLHAGLLHPQEKAIELLPHLRTDLLTHLACIFACRLDTIHNG